MTLQTTDTELVHIFETTKTIALIGASLKPNRASYRIGQFLADLGYRVIPINPGHEGKILFGEPIVTSLNAIEHPETIDMIDIFKRSELIPDIVDEALNILPNLKTVWMQLDIKNAQAAQKASDEGVLVVQDRCPKIEHARLHKNGVLKAMSV